MLFHAVIIYLLTIINASLVGGAAVYNGHHVRTAHEIRQGYVSINHTLTIPVTTVGCFKDWIRLDGILIAKHFLQMWLTYQRIGAGALHAESDGQNSAAWVCNCKHFVKDYTNPEQIDEALDLVRGVCGVDPLGYVHSGWVWSKKWQKRFNFGTVTRMSNIFERCPPACLWI